MLYMAWSPVRRTNAGRFEVDHPGDYATFNSYHPTDTRARRVLRRSEHMLDSSEPGRQSKT